MTRSTDLHRFTSAHANSNTYDQALAELQNGQKQSHWMWFVFPQLAGLGRSSTAQFYAIASLNEAQAYLADPLLGPRLRECAQTLLQHEGLSAERIFGSIDAMKLKSSMMLFHAADPADPLFVQVLGKYFNGETDTLTEKLLSQARKTSS